MWIFKKSIFTLFDKIEYQGAFPHVTLGYKIKSLQPLCISKKKWHTALMLIIFVKEKVFDTFLNSFL